MFKSNMVHVMVVCAFLFCGGVLWLSVIFVFEYVGIDVDKNNVWSETLLFYMVL